MMGIIWNIAHVTLYRMTNNEGSSWAALMEEEESSKITPGNGGYDRYS